MKNGLSIKSFAVIFVISILLSISGCGQKQNAVDYSNPNNWAYLETSVSDKQADVFFVCPTVYGGADDSFNMTLDDETTKKSFIGATNMEKGIYDDNARFFAPYYKQAGLNAYNLSKNEREKYLEVAYKDIKDAFVCYMKNYNDNRPIVLAGFSQGGDICLRLMKDYFDEKKNADLLVACYAIGWNITENEMKKYPQLCFAKSETDTGVIISFNSEAENITDSMMIPKGTKTLVINPLNWKTDETLADKSLNKCACFTDYEGNIKSEIPALTGAYIDKERGALKITDVTPEEYPPVLDIFEDGIYHLYDYQFFYRNLEENVQSRINAFCKQ